MTFLVTWAAFPVVFALVTCGLGLGLERLAGRALPGPLVIPAGFCVLVVVTQVLIHVLAPATPFVVAALAIGGLVLGRRRRPDLPHSALALGVFGLFAAPAALTLEPTFLAYQNLGDAAIHFELVDRLMQHGRSTDGLTPSSHGISVGAYLNSAYPTGTHTALGALRGLVPVDVAWTFQPYVSCLAATVALTLSALTRELDPRPWGAAAAAGLAGALGLVYAYAVSEQAMKELATIVVVTLLVALAPTIDRTWRSVLPLAVAAAAGFGVLHIAVAPWLGLVLLAVFVVVARRRDWRALAVQTGTFVVATAVLALPTLTLASQFVEVSKPTLQAGEEYGNLLRPLDQVQAFGIWPTGDFKLPLSADTVLAWVLIGAACVAAAFGVVAIVRRRAWGSGLYAVVSLIAFWYVFNRASPWGQGKALMIAAPAVGIAMAAGLAAMWRVGRRAEAGILTAAVVLGVLWTDATYYRGVDPAPYDRLAELDRIGERFAGQGPALYPEFEEFAKYFLRDTSPTGAVEAFRADVIAAQPDNAPRFGYSADLDQLAPATYANFELIVLRRGPTASRPPAGWDRAFRGTYYDVWRRREDRPQVVEHLSIGSRLDASAVPPCRVLRRLAQAGPRLAYAPRERVLAAQPALEEPLPANWTVDPGDPTTLRPIGQGRITGTVDVPTAGTYHAWLEGSFSRDVTATVAGRAVGAADDLSPRGTSFALGSLRLEAGTVPYALFRGGGTVEPGDVGTNRLVGPLYLTRSADPTGVPVRTIPSSRWRSLCGQRLDWVEALAP